MAASPHIIFRLRGLLYGVKAVCVREILRLPGLTYVEEMPVHVAGVFNLHGKIVPAIDLSILFGHERLRYSLSDGLMVIESGTRLVGIIVNEVVDIMDLSSEAIQSMPEFGSDAKAAHRFLEGEAKAGDELVMVMNIESIMQAVSFETVEDKPMIAAGAYFCADAAEAERKVFHERAKSLGMVVSDVEADWFASVAVIVLNGESFGVELDSVREFADITGLVPVPCCPSHILGGMNLRGSVLIIVDVRGALNMPSASKAALKKAVVAQAGGITVGIAVEEVFEVVYLKALDIKSAGSVVQRDNGYIKGAIPYDGRMIAYIDLKKLLTREDMIVDEEV